MATIPRTVTPAGRLRLVRHSPPRVGWRWHLQNWLRYRRHDLWRQVIQALAAAHREIIVARSTLRLATYRAAWDELAPWQAETLRRLLAENHPVAYLPAHFGGHVVDYGVVSTRVVTNAGVNYLVDSLQGTVEPENLRYHGFGTGTNAESASDTALQTELTTQYNPDNTRPTGSLGEGASANVFRTVGTLTPDSGGTIAITEHGIFSQAGTGGGTLLDRSVFAANNITAGSDSLQATYDLTLSSGG
jgi:hypothetical protein